MNSMPQRTIPVNLAISSTAHNVAVRDQLAGLDASTRNVSHTAQLFDLLNANFAIWPRVSVTGSKGKGSTSVLLSRSEAKVDLCKLTVLMNSVCLNDTSETNLA
jgi:hypothetical protein